MEVFNLPEAVELERDIDSGEYWVVDPEGNYLCKLFFADDCRVGEFYPTNLKTFMGVDPPETLYIEEGDRLPVIVKLYQQLVHDYQEMKDKIKSIFGGEL
jgi:hypothetical protein